jgi:ABC-type transport system substrate-binding protein
VYQADLAKIGVKLNLKPLEAAVWRDQVGNHKFNGLNADSSRFANLESVSVFSTSVYWLPQANAENFNNPEYKRLVDAASTEPDLAARKQLYSQLNDFLLDESFVMVLATNPPSVLTRDNVKGLRYSGHDGLLYTDTWLTA